MAETLITNLRLMLACKHQNAMELATVLDDLSHNITDTLASGTGADKANALWHGTLELLSGVPQLLDLAGMTGGTANTEKDAFGNLLTFTKIKGLLVHNKATVAGYDLKIGAGATPWVTWLGASGDIVVVRANGIMFLWAPTDGYAVTGGADYLNFDPGSNDMDVDVIIIGDQ